MENNDKNIKVILYESLHDTVDEQVYAYDFTFQVIGIDDKSETERKEMGDFLAKQLETYLKNKR